MITFLNAAAAEAGKIHRSFHRFYVHLIMGLVMGIMWRRRLVENGILILFSFYFFFTLAWLVGPIFPLVPFIILLLCFDVIL
jgi:hypothetical protein